MINFLFFVFSCIIINVLYNFVLNKLKYDEKKGIGFFIIIIPLFFYLTNNIEIININYLIWISIFIFSFIYLYDDLVGLGVISRVLVQFLSGSFLFYFNYSNSEINILIISSIFLFGIWNVFLTNAINFNDGNDGNLGFLILSYSLCFLFYNFHDNFYFNLNIALILFFVIFLFFNFYFSKFYFGDAGCLAVTLFLNQMIISEIFINQNYNYFIFLFPLIYVFIDVIYVIMYRLYNLENLFNRNYYHLYQKLYIKYERYYYLIPNILFPFLIVIINYFCLSLLNINLFYLFVLNIISIFILYFLIKFTLKL